MSGIYFDAVSKQYPDATLPAVNDVTLQVPEGSLVVLLGPSGCGKTTLLKMVNRLHEPTSGEIWLADVEIRQQEITTLRRRIGYVIQQVGLFPHMTIEQNVAVVPELLKWERSRIDLRIDELLTMVNLDPGEFRKRHPAQLSGGQQQRVGLARALAADPEVMLMDEPFGAIDAITRTSLQEEVMQLQHRLKKTILFVTHDVDEALRIADYIVVMREGRVVQFDQPCVLLGRPANDFVRKLLNTDDRVRQIGLLEVDSVMQPLPENYAYQGEPALHTGQDLRRALSLLLQPGIQMVPVLNEADQPVGAVTIERIRSSNGCDG